MSNEKQSTTVVKKPEPGPSNQRELTAEERLHQQRKDAAELIPVAMLSQHPFIRALASRVIRLERELKPILISKYQNPEATKAAFDTPVPDPVVDAWLGEVFRQANVDSRKTEELLDQQRQAEAERKDREAKIRQELAGMPAKQRAETEAALAAKAGR